MSVTPPPRMPRLQRQAARLLGGGRGEVRAMKDLMALEGVLRFTALFGVTVLLPALLLSYFALSSIRAEELVVDADVDRRADAVGEQVHHDLEAEFTRFEESSADRLANDQSPLTGLADLSPYVRVAFRFDGDGGLVGPFALPDDERPTPSPAFQRAMSDARRLELGDRPGDAVAAYQRASAAASHPAEAGQALLGRARALRRAGDPTAAEHAFADVYADYASVRDDAGFRIGDLASLERAEMADARDRDLGVVAFSDLVDKLIADRWTIGRPGEAAIARRAIDRLEGRKDADWLGRARAQIAERTTQLYWAERLAGELELLVEARTAGERAPAGEFQYIERADSGTLWATVWWRDELYAFAFDYDALKEAIRETTTHAEAQDAEIRATLLGPEASPPAGTLSIRGLNPWMPSLSVAVGPIDPDSLGATKARRRAFRIGIIVIAVGMSVVGVVLTARLLNRELESARSKADFAANVSHELRSPITQIRLKGEALQLGLVDDDVERQAHYDAIVNESERLSRLVDNVLDFSSIEQGAKTYTLRREDLADIVTKAVESGRSAIEGRGMTLEVDLPDDLPVVWADRDAIAQVVTNLLSNAAKYGADGKWAGVRARRVDGGVELVVADRGMGITKADHARIFERFYRSADPRVRRYRGTGIGLTIVRYIIEEHGGTIELESAPGQGTSFVITLPLESPPSTGA
jgi:signal transduction histidine kinase